MSEMQVNKTKKRRPIDRDSLGYRLQGRESREPEEEEEEDSCP